MRDIFSLNVRSKIFFNCYNSYFFGLDQFGVMFFKIELTYNNISKKLLTSRLCLFGNILQDVELAHCLFVVLTPNKISAIFGVRPLFIRSNSLIEFMIRSNLANTHDAFIDCKLEYFPTIVDVVNYFKCIVLQPDLIFFKNCFYDEICYSYYFNYLTSYILDLGFFPFDKKKIFMGNTSLKSYSFDEGVPAAHQNTYDERTIIKIWALYCKVRNLVLNDKRELVDLDGQILGDYHVYLVDNFFDICVFLKSQHFEYSFMNLNVYDLYVQYMEKAKSVLYMGPSVLFFITEPLSNVVREKNRLERNRIVKIKTNKSRE